VLRLCAANDLEHGNKARPRPAQSESASYR
jgi:hypothetical protein